MAIALNKRANIYLARGRLADAQQDYVAALAAEGGQSQFAYYGLGKIAEAEGDTLAARGFYGKAIAIDAGYVDAAGRLAALGVDADSRRIVLRPPAAVPSAPISSSSDQKDRLTPLPAVPPLPVPLPVTALRPGLDRPGDRIWPVDEIQLGAWRSESEATAAWQRVKARAGGLLDHLSPQVLVADLPGKGRYFRLRVRSGENAALMCARLAVKALDCFPVRD